MTIISASYHTFSIYAVLSYAQYTNEEYTRLLHSPPIRATFDALTLIGDALTAPLSSVIGINYDSATCHKCPHCAFDKWVPHHPVFKCSAGGTMDGWTQKTISCPHVQDGHEIVSLLENKERYTPFVPSQKIAQATAPEKDTP